LRKTGIESIALVFSDGAIIFWPTANSCQTANALLAKYEMKERILLLELVAWKAACIHRLDEMKRESGVLVFRQTG